MANFFTPQRIPRRDDPAGHMTVWQDLLDLVDAINTKYGKRTQGAAKILSGNTSILVTHSLGVAAYRVEATPTDDPTARYWVSNKTATQFQINLSAAAPVAGVNFDWIVEGD